MDLSSSLPSATFPTQQGNCFFELFLTLFLVCDNVLSWELSKITNLKLVLRYDGDVNV